MSTVDINRVVAQMRIAASQAASMSTPIAQSQNSGFTQALEKAINTVNDLQLEAGRMTTAFEKGEDGIDLPEVMISVQKSSVAFQAMVEVRNKLVSAYQEIMNMPV